MAIRPAFFGLTSVLNHRIRENQRKVPQLRAFPKPVGIIFGRDDPYLHPGVAKAFDDIFPQSRLWLVPNAGHYVQLDQPERVAELIRIVGAR